MGIGAACGAAERAAWSYGTTTRSATPEKKAPAFPGAPGGPSDPETTLTPHPPGAPGSARARDRTTWDEPPRGKKRRTCSAVGIAAAYQVARRVGSVLAGWSVAAAWTMVCTGVVPAPRGRRPQETSLRAAGPLLIHSENGS